MSATDITYLPIRPTLREELEQAGILLSPGVRSGLVNQALDLVAEEYEVSVADLKGDCRIAHLARARRAAFAALRHVGLSYTAIGRVMRKDHTTVIAGVRKFATERAMNKKLDTGL